MVSSSIVWGNWVYLAIRLGPFFLLCSALRKPSMSTQLSIEM